MPKYRLDKSPSNEAVAMKLLELRGSVKSCQWNGWHQRYTSVLKWFDELGITARVRGKRVLRVALDEAVRIIRNAPSVDVYRYPRKTHGHAHPSCYVGYLEVDRDWCFLGDVLFRQGARFDCYFISNAPPAAFPRLRLRNLQNGLVYESDGKEWVIEGEE